MVGLSNVKNTATANKPVSTGTEAALDCKLELKRVRHNCSDTDTIVWSFQTLPTGLDKLIVKGGVGLGVRDTKGHMGRGTISGT